MTAEGGKRAVTFSAILVVSSVSLNAMVPKPSDKDLAAKYPDLGKGTFPSMRTLIGTGITFTILAALAEPAPELAGMLALAVGFTALTLYTLPLLDVYFTHAPPAQVKGKGKTP